jgi:hypothetical protein
VTDLTLTGLRVVLEVARTGSFSAAAERLGYTQSAVSRQVAVTEKAVGTPLFERHARGTRPTPAGNRSNPTSSQTRGGSSGPVPAAPPSSAHGPASPSQGSPSQPAAGPPGSGPSPPDSGSPWCPASPPRRCRAACAGSRSTTTPAGSGGQSGRRPITIPAQPRPPWSTPWRKRPVPRRATVHQDWPHWQRHREALASRRVQLRIRRRHRDDTHDRQARDERCQRNQPSAMPR